MPAAYDVTGLSLANAFHAEHRVPVEADYVIHAVAGGTRPAGSEPIQLTLWIDGGIIESKVLDPEALASFSDDQQDFLSKGVEFTVHLKAGTHWIAVAIPHLYEGLPTTYNGPNPSARPIPPPPVFKPWPSATPEQIEKARKHFEEEHKDTPPANNVRVAYLELNGPYKQVTTPSTLAYKRIFICGHRPGHHLATCPQQIVASLAARAFRRPVTVAERQPYLRLYADVRRRGGSFEEGIALALQGVLVSPDFLFRLEQMPSTPDPRAVSDYELATRLSYFLWASMPDAELRRLAATHQLRTPGGPRGAGPAHAARSEVRIARRRSSAASGCRSRALESVRPDADKLPGLRRLPAAVDAQGDRALLRRRSSGRTAASSTSSTRRTRS